ncbi:hypothetical protein HPB51_011012 [Rhipicephalus microplus]|uniref:Uncharacterized protein n=1 Tax=Rhipicephalus microplus TaxID=6941 RepID=A0A9J6END9_RHIMP|nr:hypothetical protein HPB51_011012 [Rhipicephalus microplus]
MEHDSSLDVTTNGERVPGASCTVKKLEHMKGEKLPSKYWSMCLLADAPNAVAFTVCAQDGDSVCFKKLVLCSAEDTCYNCVVFVQGKVVKKVDVFDVNAVESLLHSMNEMVVCSGFEQAPGLFGRQGRSPSPTDLKSYSSAAAAAMICCYTPQLGRTEHRPSTIRSTARCDGFYAHGIERSNIIAGGGVSSRINPAVYVCAPNRI